MKKRFRVFISILLAMTLTFTLTTNVFATTSQPAAGSILVTVTNATGTLSTATDLNFTVLDDLGTTVVTSLSSASPTNGVYKIPAPSAAGFDKGTYYVQITEDSYKHNSLTVPVTVSSPTSNATSKVIWTKAPDDLSQIPGSKIAIVGGTAMSVSESADPVLAKNSAIDLWDSKGNCYSTWSDGTTGVYKFYVPAGKYTVCAEASASSVVKAYSVTAAAGQMNGPYEEVVTNRTDASYDIGYSAPTGDKTNLCDSKIFTGQANAGCTVEIVNAGSTTSQHILGKAVATAAKGAAKGTFKITLKSCYPGSKLEVWVIDTAHNIYVDNKTLDFSGSSFTMTATMPSSTTNDKDIAIKLADSAHPGNLTTITGVSYSTDGSVYTPLVITTQYTFVSGSLNILKNTLTAGTYTFKITAPGYNTLTTGAYIFTAPASAALTVSAAPGSAAGTTKLTVTPASGDSIKYLISSSLIASATLDTNVSGYTAYTTLGSDISGVDAATNKYLAVAEVNASGKVVKFKCLTLTSSNIKAGSAGSTDTTAPVFSFNGIVLGSIVQDDSKKTLSVSVDKGTSSVRLQAQYQAANQTASVGGTNANAVALGSAPGAPSAMYTINTADISSAGGSKTFTATISRSGEKSITYNVTVSVMATAWHVQSFSVAPYGAYSDGIAVGTTGKVQATIVTDEGIDNTVKWTLTGNTDSNTKIVSKDDNDNTCQVQIGANETAGQIKLTATSNAVNILVASCSVYVMHPTKLIPFTTDKGTISGTGTQEDPYVVTESWNFNDDLVLTGTATNQDLFKGLDSNNEDTDWLGLATVTGSGTAAPKVTIRYTSVSDTYSFTLKVTSPNSTDSYEYITINISK